MAAYFTDTIFAQATAVGRAGISVVRLSGPESFTTLKLMCGGVFPPRTAQLRWISDPRTAVRIDQGLVLSFPGPGSFTGEDVVELHLHGSPAVVRQVLRCLGELPGLRLAEPGEFTRRAILNGRMDVTQAEGLGDLLAAETEVQRRRAFEVMDGHLSRTAETWRVALLRVLARLEVTIDFADEELPETVLDGVWTDLGRVTEEMGETLAGSAQAERLRDGFEVAIVGAPNAGKSTLLNYLAGREAALTSAIPGTTRDIIELRYDLDGLPVTFLDTAGIRETEDAIEALGVARAVARAERADVRVFLEQDATAGRIARPEERPGDLRLRGKVDLEEGSSGGISGKTGAGVSEMLAHLKSVLEVKVSGASLVAHERQRRAITSAHGILCNLLDRRYIAEDQPELFSEDVRSALAALDYLVGRFDIETVFDEIFRNFCLGK